MVEEVQLQGSSFFFSGSCTVDGKEGGGFGWRNLRLFANEDPEAGAEAAGEMRLTLFSETPNEALA